MLVMPLCEFIFLERGESYSYPPQPVVKPYLGRTHKADLTPIVGHCASVGRIGTAAAREPYLTASPDVTQTDVALNTIAEEDVIASELVAGLRIEANTAAQQGSHTAGKLQPRRLFNQRHRIDTEQRRCLGTPIPPQIGAHIRLPHLTVVAVDGPRPAQADPAGRTRGRARACFASELATA